MLQRYKKPMDCTSLKAFIYQVFSSFFVSFFIPHIAHLDTLNHHHQLCPPKRITPADYIVTGHGKASLFEPLVINHQATPFPVKQFNGRSHTVDKYKHFSTQGVATHLRANHPAKGIKAFAHIAIPGKKIIPV
jgi:hypothetical protein